MVQTIGEGGILPGFGRGLLQFRQGGDQGFGHVLTAKLAVAPQAVGTRLQSQICRINGRQRSAAGHRRRSKITAA